MGQAEEFSSEKIANTRTRGEVRKGKYRGEIITAFREESVANFAINYAVKISTSRSETQQSMARN